MGTTNRAWLAFVSAALLIAGCGGGGSGGNGNAVLPPITLQSIAVTPPSPWLLGGLTTQFTATGAYSDGHTADITSSVAWSSSNTSAVTISSSGLGAGAAVGSSVVTATMGTVSGQTTVTVPPLQTIEVQAQTDLNLAIGETRQHTAIGAYPLPVGGTGTVDLTNAVTWTTHPAEVASISGAGLATAIATGTTTVSATFGGVTGTRTLRVSPPSGTTLRIVRPAHASIVESGFLIAVDARGTREIASVTAAVAGKSMALAFSLTGTLCSGGLTPPPGPCWTGNFDLSGVSKGRHTLTVVATDVTNQQTTAYQAIVYDSAPSLQVAQPTAHTASRGTLRLTATCSDDASAGCSSLIAHLCERSEVACSKPVAQGVASLDTEVTVQAHDGKQMAVVYEARDSLGQQTFSAPVPVFIETSSKLRTEARVPGLLLDADGQRLLYLSADGSSVHIRDRTTGADTRIYSALPPPLPEQPAFLTSTGAAFTVGVSNERSGISWEAGSSVALDGAGVMQSLRGSGSYLSWSHDNTLWRRDLAAQSSSIISTEHAGDDFDVASNGAVAFATHPGRDIWLYRPDGTASLLADGSTTPLFDPVTDGDAVVYRKDAARCCGNQPASLILNEGGVEQPLTALMQRVTFPYLFPDVLARMVPGWIAYLNTDSGNVLQVWRRDALGVQTQLTTSHSDSLLDELGPDGSVTFTNGSRRYLVGPATTAPVEIGSKLGSTVFVGGLPHVIVGDSLLAVQ